jgi:hypothetical protein
VARIKDADKTAYDALKEAQTAVRTPGFAESKAVTLAQSAAAAVRTFTNLANQYRPKE